MVRLRVLIAEDSPPGGEGLRALLDRLGHSVAGTARDGRDAVAKAESLAPDLVLLDVTMIGPDGIEVVRQIMAHRPLPIVLVAAHDDPDLIAQATLAGVMGYLVKPVDSRVLSPALALAVSRFADLIGLRKDVQSLKEALILRQQTQRAKGILGKRMGLSEAEAHKKLQHLARHERCTLIEAAGRVVAADKLFIQLESLT